MSDKQEECTYPVRSLYFYLTEGCNLRCRHCWIRPKYQTEDHRYPALDYELFKSIIEQAKPMGLTSVKLTGGEPLIHPQILNILKLIQTEKLRLVVETNGISCSSEISRAAAACKNPFVSISLDGANAVTHEWMRGVNGCFEIALEGIRNLVKVGIKPQIIMSLVRRNRDQVESIVRLAESLGCGSIKFNIVQPTARGEQMHTSGETLTVEELVKLGEWVERDLSAATSLPLYFSHPLAFRPLGNMFGEDGCGIGRCGILGIMGVLANGSYAMCGIGETVPELIYGHAAKDRLEDVWKNAPILLELRKGMPNNFEGICSQCLVRDTCLGYCVAQSYYSTGNLWASYWYCDQARDKGLFPETRIFPTTSERIKVE